VPQEQVQLPAAIMSASPFGPPPSEEETVDLKEFLTLLRRRILLVVSIVVTVTALAALFAYSRTPRYQAIAAVRVADVRGALTGGIEEAALERLAGSVVDPVASQIEILRSRSLLERAMNDGALRVRSSGFSAAYLQDVDLDPETPSDTLGLGFSATGFTVRRPDGEVSSLYGMPVRVGGLTFTISAYPEVSSGELVVLPADLTLSFLMSRLSARTRDRTDVVELRFEARDSVMASRILNVIVEAFQHGNARRAQEQSRRRRAFVQDQLEQTDSLLDESRIAFSEFRQRERLYSSRERFQVQQQALTQLEMRLEELNADRRMYAELLDRLVRSDRADDGSLQAVMSTPGIASNPVVMQLYGQLTRYQSSLDSLMAGGQGRAPSDPDVLRLDALVSGSRANIADAVRSHIASVDARRENLVDLQRRYEAEIQGMPNVESEELVLAQQMRTIESVAEQLRQELQRARIAEAVEAGQVEIVDLAGPAERLPSRRPLILLAGLVFGMVAGAGAALVVERLDNSLRRREDVERLGVTVVGVIPHLLGGTERDRKRRRQRVSRNGRERPEGKLDPALVTIHNSRSSGAEAYRTLRTNLIFSQALDKLRVLVVTSPGPGEGKSTTASNLAIAFAQQGLRVLLVDCDLRRPRVQEVFEIPREPGLTQLLVGHCTLDEASRPGPVEGLRLLTAGTLPPNPSEVLGSERTRVVIDEMKAAFDMVLIDTPPVLLASDSSVLSIAADGVIVVLRADKTPRAAGQQALKQLRSVGAKVIGAVLNDPDSVLASYDGYYGYGYGYGYDAYHRAERDAEEPEEAGVVASR
jgi:capsular exopolysaccharide synthesis family protein